MSAIKSLLKEVVKNLPEGSVKAQSVVPQLMKKGVKAEELEFAAMNLPSTGKVSKQQLVDAEAGRKDTFYTTETKGFQNISLPAGKDNPTYKMKVLSFNEQGRTQAPADVSAQSPEVRSLIQAVTGIDGHDDTMIDAAYEALEQLESMHGVELPESLPGYMNNPGVLARDLGLVEQPTSRYASSHTDVPDYLAHTRIFDEDWDGAPVRVLQEIQSDLHQAGRQQGYDSGAGEGAWTVTPEQRNLLENIDPYDDNSIDEAYGLMSQLGADDIVDELGVPGAIEEVLGGADKKLTNIPKSPHEKQWLRKGIERELVDAIEEGRTQLAIPISGADIGNLARAEGVQKWYETQVVNTAKKVAKASGSDFEMVTKGNTEYAVVKPKGEFVDKNTVLDHLEGTAETGKAQTKEFKTDKPFSFSLYSSPAAAAGVAYMAYKQGASEQQVTEALEAKGFDYEDVQVQLEFLTQAVDQGASVKEAIKYLETKDTKAKTVEKRPMPVHFEAYTKGYGDAPDAPEEYDTFGRGYGGAPTPQNARDGAFAKMIGKGKMDDEELLATLKTYYPIMSSNLLTDLPSMVGNEAAAQKYEKARESSRWRIQELFKEKTGRELLWKPLERTPGVFSETEAWQVQGEDGQYHELDAGLWESLKQESHEIVGGLLGGVRGGYKGGIGGMVLGAQSDYLFAAMKLQEEVEAEALTYTAANAGELGIIGEAVAFPVMYLGGKAGSAIVDIVKNQFKGNTVGAAKALKEVTFLNDDQIEEIVKQVERYGALPGSRTAQGISAVTQTLPGMEKVVAASAPYGSANRMLAETIKRRTTGVLAETAALTDDHVPIMLKNDLQNYTADVKEAYRTVKARATEAPNAAKFSYNFNELAIMPILEETADKVFNPAVREKFLNQMRRVRTLTDSTGFGNLIELRQLVNDFLYNTKVAASDRTAIRGALTSIDTAITDGAGTVMGSPKQWLDDWAKVRSEYSEMKKVEQGAMWKAIFDKDGKMRPINPKQVVNRMTKYITALDGSFEDTVSKLPIAGRSKYEGAIIDNIANKYTMQDTAMHFPQIAKELAQVNFTSPDARAMKKVLMELGETFQNDVKLVNAATGMHIPTVMQGLTADLGTKLKFELASNTYSKLRGLLPGEEHRRVDLVKKLNAMIEEPLNQKAATELMEVAKGDTKITETIRQLQQEAARRKAAGEVSNKIHFYGNGKVKKLKGTGPVTKVPEHRILTTEEARVIAESEAMTLDSKYLDDVLKAHGYLAIQHGSDSIRMFK